MKILFATLFYVSFGQFAFCQKIDTRLLENYSESYLIALQNENVKDYNLLVYAIDNACYTAQAPTGKSSDISQKIIWSVNEDPNFLDVNREFGIVLENFNQYILMEGTDKMLVVKSKFVLENELTNKK
jgi:hypothetical protein